MEKELVEKKGLFLGTEEITSKKTGEIYVQHKFVFDTEIYSVFDNEDRELSKIITSNQIKSADRIICSGELKLRKSKEGNTYWNYQIKQIKKV